MTEDSGASVSKMQPKKVGLFGGTFDPIHYTHLHIAERAREEHGLDEVWFIPTYSPPHKQDRTVTEARHRIEMVKRAIAGVPYFDLNLIEIETGGPSYTYETVEALQNRYPSFTFFFILGADMVESLPSWYQIDELLQRVAFLAVGRPGWSLEVRIPANVSIIEMIPSTLSATQIRTYVRQGKSIRFLVPEEVYHYIRKYKLYGGV